MEYVSLQKDTGHSRTVVVKITATVSSECPDYLPGSNSISHRFQARLDSHWFTASFPGLLHFQFFYHLQHAKTVAEGLGNLIMWSVAQLSYCMPSLPFHSHVRYKTDLAFWTSYKDGTIKCQQRAAPSVRNVSRLKNTAEWQAWKYPAVMQSSYGVKRRHLFGVALLILYSHPSAL